MKVIATRTILVWMSLVMVGLFSVSVSYAIDPAAIVGLWLFDEGAGDVATDSSGNGNDGVLINEPEWVDGKFGKALRFDGVDDYVDIPDSPSLSPTEQMSIVAWIYPVIVVTQSFLKSYKSRVCSVKMAFLLVL